MNFEGSILVREDPTRALVRPRMTTPATKPAEEDGYRNITDVLIEYIQQMRYTWVYGQCDESALVQYDMHLDHRMRDPDAYETYMREARENLDDEEQNRLDWRERVLDGEVEWGAQMPANCYEHTLAFMESSKRVREPNFLTVRDAIDDYLAIRDKTYRGFEPLIEQGRWDELFARLDEDEAMVRERFYVYAPLVGNAMVDAVRECREQIIRNHGPFQLAAANEEPPRDEHV